ncbi:MAG: c-type cytochrome biogenesis protein CcmI [Gallionellaceae bacterium]|nr:c-type cytochrome biogenesis protein CcmI [Gallionellaceae bacterium]
MNSTTTFLVIAVVLVAIALAFLLPPLLRNRRATAKTGRRSINIAVYRDQMREMAVDHHNGLLNDDQFGLAKIDLEARLAQDAIDSPEDVQPVSRGGRVLGITLAVLLPLAAFGLYYQLGNPDALTAGAGNTAVAGANGEHDIMKMIQKVEEKTQAEPDNVEAWFMLAKSYAAVDRWPDAQQAYEKAIALNPASAAILTGYAEALAINNNRVLQGKPMELVRKALAIDPTEIKGLELAGISSFQDKNYVQAAGYFERLYKQLPPESPYAQDIAKAMAEAKRLAEGGPAQLDNLSAPPAQAAAQPAAAGSAISGLVDIAPALKAKTKPQDVVYLFARSAQGGAPVAVIRGNAGNFPLEFELTDAMAMTPENRLSTLKEVTLVARVSKSGDVTAAPGDLEGSLAKVKVGAKGVKLVIDTVRN